MATQAPPAPDSLILQRLAALADDTRMRIAESLRGGERCVCEIQDILDVEQSLLSYHLRLLRKAGLVSDRREGRWIHYTLAKEALEEVEAYLAALRSGPSTSGGSGAACFRE